MSLENMSRLASLMAVSEWQPINDDSEVSHPCNKPDLLLLLVSMYVLLVSMYHGAAIAGHLLLWVVEITRVFVITFNLYLVHYQAN